MSDTLVVTFLTLGVVLLFLGLVGQVKAQVIEIGTKNRAVRVVASLLGLAFISISLFFVFSPSTKGNAKPGSIPPTGSTSTAVVAAAEVAHATVVLPTSTAIPTAVPTEAPPTLTLIPTEAPSTPTSLPAATPTTPSRLTPIYDASMPDQALLSYYGAIKDQNYEAAWNLVTQHYQTARVSGYSKFERFWEAYQEVKILSMKLTNRLSDKVVIQATIIYVYKTGLETEKHTYNYIMVIDPATGSWLLDDTY